MSSPRKKKFKVGAAPSQTHRRACQYCDELVLVKNYPRHLTRVKFADTFKRIQYENTLREHFSKIATKMIH